MAIRLLCECGSFSVESGPTRDLVDVKSRTELPLRRIFGPDAVVRMSGRQYLVRIGRDRLTGFFTDVFERYGA